MSLGIIGSIAASSALAFTPSVSTGTLLLEEAKLVASDGTASDLFGLEVAISGDTAVVGARLDGAVASFAGSAYVFVRSGTTWNEQQKLTASDAASSDVFGYSVSIDGETAVIGAPGNDDGGNSAGSAYVFVRSGTAWTEQQKLTASDPSASANFGAAVSISGDTLVVGAYGSGSAYVFVQSGTTWSEQQKLTASDAAALDEFGEAVSISGDIVTIGAAENDDAGFSSGSAYVFVRSGTTWSEEQKLTASDAAAGERFGTSVSVSGDTAVIGANDEMAGTASGSAYVFVQSGTTWSEEQELTASDASLNDWFGRSVAISGDRIAVGAYADDAFAFGTGSAYVFARTGTAWTEEQKLTASDAAASDAFGVSVSISDGAIAIGAYLDDDAGSDSGSAYVFQDLPSPFASFCDASDGALASCPCSNPGDPDTGCDNAQSTGGVKLDATSYVGSSGKARLWGLGYPPAAQPTAIVIRATGLEASPVVFGDGLRCIGLPLVRFGATAAFDGASVHVVNHGAGPGVFHYQLWYRSTPATFCDAASAFNTSNGLSITWP